MYKTDLIIGLEPIRQLPLSVLIIIPHMVITRIMGSHCIHLSIYVSVARKRMEELDAQLALSEYFFSGAEDDGKVKGEDNDSDDGDGDDRDVSGGEDCLFSAVISSEISDSEVLAEYYGYTSGSDMAIESLFLASSGDDNNDDDDRSQEDESGA